MSCKLDFVNSIFCSCGNCYKCIVAPFEILHVLNEFVILATPSNSEDDDLNSTPYFMGVVIIGQ